LRYNVHDFIFSPAKLASLSADKLFSFQQTYLFQVISILKHSSFLFLSLDAEKLNVAGGTRKEKYSLSGKVLERRFYWEALT
jgi:hypothetical protein